MIVMYSSLFYDKAIKTAIAPHLKKKRIAYIPASYYDNGKECFDDYLYYQLGFRSKIAFPLGEQYDAEKLKLLMDCSAIHLGGGNTFEFIFLMKQRGMIDVLRRFEKKGGVLIGTSAGSISMCPDVQIASFADDNFMNLKGEFLNGIGRVDYYVKPHWEGWAKYYTAFQKFADIKNRRIYCLKETQAIVVDGKTTKYIGGKPTIITPRS